MSNLSKAQQEYDDKETVLHESHRCAECYHVCDCRDGYERYLGTEDNGMQLFEIVDCDECTDCREAKAQDSSNERVRGC